MTIIYHPTQEFWKELFPDGMTAEDITKELEDLAFVSENISKVYMHVTGGQASKPMIFAEVINALYDDHCTDMHSYAVEDVIEVIEAQTGFDSVRTTWDQGMWESIRAELIERIKQEFNVK